eukprot:5146467-Lingulodinium_polyedra.AAC.1
MRDARTASTTGGVRGRRPKPAAEAAVNHVSSLDWRPPAADAANFASRSSTNATSSLLGPAA